jgi:hypothetical protein
MTRFLSYLVLLLFSSTLFSCGNNHFTKDEAYLKQVKQDFEHKKEQLPAGNLFEIFNQGELSVYEREALMFLYAYMPMGDITDYPGGYYLENIRLSRQAKTEMPWGKDIPEDIFRHFVLPIRVNNENLDDSRRVFYAELKNRVKNMSLHDAVLEVNHWCHEKVIYTASDARTSAPLSSVKTAFGRCGEESTFTVAALRSVGIPARQVYTPRWAHTDDNHAWVEAWVDGRWYFLGACEPEPVLNLGWFNSPASRGMLMHSKVFGRYEGKEEIMLATPLYTEINLIQNYAPTGKSSIEVVDRNGKPAVNAKVEFKVYNYAEFYTAATRYTDSEGLTSLSAGRGDMLVWASKDGMFGYARVSFGKDNQVKIILDREEGAAYSVSMDIVPPSESPNVPEVTPEQRAENGLKLEHEDSVRNAYVSTFMNKEQADAFVGKHSLPEKAAGLLIASRGNWETLTAFLLDARKKNAERKAVNLLSVISNKDLRDVSHEVLEDHLYNTPQELADTALFNTYILNPRVGNEMILPYKSFFREAFPAADREKFRNDPQKLMEWCKNNITVKEELNLPNMIISPVGVWKARVSDSKSRKVFFVSLARSLGIPTWLDEVTGKIQYMKYGTNSSKGQVSDIDFNRQETVQPSAGRLILNYKPAPAVTDPKYYTHFSISKFQGGTFRLLSYNEGDVDMGGGAGWSRRFKGGIKMDAGYYMLVSGVRQSDGSVPVRISFFKIEEGKTTSADLILRENKEKKAEIIGHFDAASSFRPLESANTEKLSEHCGADKGGYYVLAILGPGQEPTNHALRDIAAMGRDFEEWGQQIVFLFRDKDQSRKFHASDFPGLPPTITCGIDENGTILKQLAESLRLPDKTLLPVVIIANTAGEVVFKSQGYTIGLGEQLIGAIKLLE